MAVQPGYHPRSHRHSSALVAAEPPSFWIAADRTQSKQGTSERQRQHQRNHNDAHVQEPVGLTLKLAHPLTPLLKRNQVLLSVVQCCQLTVGQHAELLRLPNRFDLTRGQL